LDAGKAHDERPGTFEDIVAELYNDEIFIAVTEALLELHMDFDEPIMLPFDKMPGGGTLE
jgi:hypothetical protein